MAKDRERACEHYICEGKCAKGHKGTFKDTCQTCKDYIAKRGSRPRRKDLRKEKNASWEKNMRNFDF